MENKFRITECELVGNEGTSLNEKFSLLNGSPVIEYYESVRSPSISINVSFRDTDGVVSNESIMGGEYLNLNVEFAEFGSFKLDPIKHRMMVNAVRNVETKSSNQTASLEFISVETIINETARINRRFTGNISQTVSRLIGPSAESKGVRTTKELFSESTGNAYTFVGNLKRPIDTIQWLCPKAAISPGGSGSVSSPAKIYGFLFFENLDGYVFKSVDTLLKQPTTVRYRKEEIASESAFRILNENFNRSNDIGINLRTGMYANKTIYVDMESAEYSVTDYTVSELKPTNPPKLPTGLEESPSRLMMRMKDPGAMQTGAKRDELEPQENLAVYQNYSYARNNLLFSQSLNIVVPCNPTLRAGQTVDIDLPLPTSDQKSLGYGTDGTDLSGKYLISELKHEIGGNKAHTQLSLVRDTFTATA